MRDVDLKIASWQSLMIVCWRQVVSTDPKPMGEGNAIHVQCVQIGVV